MAAGQGRLGASLVTGDGEQASSGPQIDLAALPPSVVVAGLATVSAEGFGDPGPGRRIGPPEGRALARSWPRCPVPALLDGRHARRSRRRAERSSLVDATGPSSPRPRAPFDPSALPGEVLDLATMANHDSDGRASVDLPGIDGWQVVVSAPIPLVSLPIQALAALVALLALLFGFTSWMARQILRPARRWRPPGRASASCTRRAREAALRDSLTGPRQPPRLPGGGRADGRGRPALRHGLLARPHRHRRVQAHQRHARPRHRRPAPGRGRRPHQRDDPHDRRRLPRRRRRVRAPPAAHRRGRARCSSPGASSPAASRTGPAATTARRSRSRRASRPAPSSATPGSS